MGEVGEKKNYIYVTVSGSLIEQTTDWAILRENTFQG
jgi:hypothetical protein